MNMIKIDKYSETRGWNFTFHKWRWWTRAMFEVDKHIWIEFWFVLVKFIKCEKYCYDITVLHNDPMIIHCCSTTAVVNGVGLTFLLVHCSYFLHCALQIFHKTCVLLWAALCLFCCILFCWLSSICLLSLIFSGNVSVFMV